MTAPAPIIFSWGIERVETTQKGQHRQPRRTGAGYHQAVAQTSEGRIECGHHHRYLFKARICGGQIFGARQEAG
jgi:hypothetical protein